MPDPMSGRKATLAALSLGLSMLAGAIPALGAAPQPVLPLDEPPRPRADEPSVPPPSCLGGTAGRAASGSTASATATVPADDAFVIGHRPLSAVTTYPAPILPLGPGDGQGTPIDEPGERPTGIDCTVELSLALVIRSPSGERPQDVSAWLGDVPVSQAALESGFSGSLPAQSRAITLNTPGGDWKLVSTSCTCSPLLAAPAGGWSLLELAAYPAPVLPLGPGAGSCRGGTSAARSEGASFAWAPVAGQLAHSMTYPAPILPLEPGSREGGSRDVPPEDREPGRPATVSWQADGTVTIDDPDRRGAYVQCTWIIEQELLTPRSGPWRSSNGVGRIDCGAFSQRIPAGDRDMGRISHRRGGDRLIARGVSADSSGPITLDRVGQQPRRYVGTLQASFRGGSATFRFVFDVVTEERIKGRLSASVRVQGRSCTVRRPFELTYAGGG